MINIVEKLIEPFDNIHAAAKALGYDHQLLYNWKRQGYIPYKKGDEIEKKTNGRIKASEIWQSASKALKG